MHRSAIDYAVFLVLSTYAGLSSAQSDNSIPGRVAALEAKVAALQAQLGALAGNGFLAAGDKASFDAATDTLVLTGMNLNIRSGAPFDPLNLPNLPEPNGKGNLIIGYDAPRRDYMPEICSKGQYATQATCAAGGGIWARDHKSGSHNLIVGEGHAYSSVGGVLFGLQNASTQPGAAVTGGAQSFARGLYSSVTAGTGNEASGPYSSVSAGAFNKAIEQYSSVSGGGSNKAAGLYANVGGGFFGNASGFYSTISGGGSNTASGSNSAVSGGRLNTASGSNSTVKGGANNTASAADSLVP